MSEIEKMLKEGESEEDIQFSPAEIEKEWSKTKERTESKWMMGIYGREGTCKSGILLDLRTEEEKKDGTKIVIIDIDESCRPLWESYWDCDPNIRIFDPVVSVGKGTERDVSYIASYRKVIAILGWLEENINKRNIKYVAIDGIDTFLKWCEHVMKEVDMGNINVHNSEVGYNWGKRNQRYYRVLNWLKRLPVASFVTAHLDEREDIVSGKNKIGGPNWHNGTRQDTADELYQIVRTEKKEQQRGNYNVKDFVAEIEKWKGNINMEGKKFRILQNKVDSSNNEAKAKWEGLIPKVRNHLDKKQNINRMKGSETEGTEPPKDSKKESQSIIDEATSKDSTTDDELLETEEEAEEETEEETEEEPEEQESEKQEEEDTEEQETESKEQEEDTEDESEQENDGEDDWMDSF